MTKQNQNKDLTYNQSLFSKSNLYKCLMKINLIKIIFKI